VTDSSSFSTRITYFTGSVFGTSSKVVNGVYTTDTGSVSNNMLAGNIANSKLVNSSILIGTSSVSLGATASSLTGLDNLSANSVTVSGQPTTYGYVNGSYLFAYNNADQSSVGQNGAVNFQVTSVNNGSLITKTSNSQITLKAGNTYILRAVIGRLQSSSTWAQFKWYDVTNGVYVGAEGFSEVVNSSGAIGSTNVPTAYVTPNVNTTYELRQTTVNTITVNAYASMEVIQVNPTIAVQATATGTLNTDYIQVEKSSDQSFLSSGSDINFQVITATNSGIPHSAGVFTLKAGKTYLLEATLCVNTFTSTSAYIWYSWVDATNNAQLDTSNGGATSTGASGIVTPSTWTSNDGYTSAARLIYTPSTNQTVKLRATDGSGTCKVLTIGTRATITQIANTFSLNALDTMTTTGNVTVGGSLVATGSFTAKGEVTIGTSNGNEGGQINMALAQNNQTLTGSMNIDVYQNRMRFWEGGGNARGVYVDLSKAPDSVGGELMWKASGMVNAGVDVTLGNLRARIPTSGNRSLQVSTVSGTYTVYGSDVYYSNGVGGATIDGATPLSVTTTPAYLRAANNFNGAGQTDTWTIMDTGAGLAWRITCIIGMSYNNNMISIERLV
jgi:hypothetical protein